MDKSNMHKWLTFCFLVPSSLVLAYFIFYLATFTPSYAASTTSSSTSEVRLVPPSPDKIILVKGQTQTIDKIELTYLGMDTGSVVIDITLLELDPKYAYRRKISKKVAHRGFQLAQQQYQLISAGRDRLKMVRAKG